MIVAKQIRPNKLDDEAFRLAFIAGMKKAGDGIKKDFEATQETWEDKDKAKFEMLMSLESPGPTVVVAPNENAEVWIMVDKGTPPHTIAPKLEGGLLVFQTGYKAKTSPGVIGSVQGGKSGGYTKRKSVNHPGFEGRHFDKAIQQKWTPRFKDLMQEAMKSAVAKSGHAKR